MAITKNLYGCHALQGGERSHVPKGLQPRNQCIHTRKFVFILACKHIDISQTLNTRKLLSSSITNIKLLNHKENSKGYLTVLAFLVIHIVRKQVFRGYMYLDIHIYHEIKYVTSFLLIPVPQLFLSFSPFVFLFLSGVE